MLLVINVTYGIFHRYSSLHFRRDSSLHFLAELVKLPTKTLNVSMKSADMLPMELIFIGSYLSKTRFFCTVDIIEVLEYSKGIAVFWKFASWPRDTCIILKNFFVCFCLSNVYFIEDNTIIC